MPSVVSQLVKLRWREARGIPRQKCGNSLGAMCVLCAVESRFFFLYFRYLPSRVLTAPVSPLGTCLARVARCAGHGIQRSKILAERTQHPVHTRLRFLSLASTETRDYTYIDGFRIKESLNKKGKWLANTQKFNSTPKKYKLKA